MKYYRQYLLAGLKEAERKLENITDPERRAIAVSNINKIKKRLSKRSMKGVDNSIPYPVNNGIIR